MTSLFDLKQRRLLLLAKKHLAEQKAFQLDIELTKELRNMTAAEADLLRTELEIQQAQRTTERLAF